MLASYVFQNTTTPHIFIAGFIPPSGLIQAESQGLQGCSWSNTQIKKVQNQNPSIFGWRSSATRTSQVKIRDQVTESRTTGKVEGGKGRGGGGGGGGCVGGETCHS